jgi:hypothetical protein
MEGASYKDSWGLTSRTPRPSLVLHCIDQREANGQGDPVLGKQTSPLDEISYKNTLIFFFNQPHHIHQKLLYVFTSYLNSSY